MELSETEEASCTCTKIAARMASYENLIWQDVRQYLTARSAPLWPDLAKYRHSGKMIIFLAILCGVLSIWQNFQPTLAILYAIRNGRHLIDRISDWPNPRGFTKGVRFVCLNRYVQVYQNSVNTGPTLGIGQHLKNNLAIWSYWLNPGKSSLL